LVQCIFMSARLNVGRRFLGVKLYGCIQVRHSGIRERQASIQRLQTRQELVVRLQVPMDVGYQLRYGVVMELVL